VADSVRTQRLAIGVLVAGFLLLVGWPLARLAGVAVERGLGTVVATLTAPASVEAIVNSAWTSALVALLAVTAGAAAALATERMDLSGRRWLRLGLLLPLVVPPFVSADAWAQAYGPRGLLDQLVGVSIPGLYGPVGIVFVLAVAATPLAWLIIAAALSTRAEPDLERAARASGAGPWEAFRTITLPLLRPALWSAAVIVFVFAINAFGVPAVLGTPAGFPTITTRIYEDLARSADPAAFVEATTMALGLVVLAMLVIGAADALLGRRPTVRTSLPAGSAVARAGRRLPAAILAAAIAGAILVPLGALVLTALTRAVGLPPVPANWTLANFGTALDERFAGGLANSLILATIAATVVLALGALATAAIQGKGRSRGLGTAVALGFAVPGSALAVAVLLAYGGWIRDSLTIILVAYVAKFWAIGHRQLAGSVDRLPPDQPRAARASGAGPIDALSSVVWPALRGPAAAGWLIVFVFALHELTMSSLLYGPGTAPLAVVVLDTQQLGDPTISAALAVLLTAIVVLAAAPLIVISWRAERRRPGEAQP